MAPSLAIEMLTFAAGGDSTVVELASSCYSEIARSNPTPYNYFPLFHYNLVINILNLSTNLTGKVGSFLRHL